MNISAYEIFDSLQLIGETSSELKKRQGEFNELLHKAVPDQDIYEAINSAAMDAEVEAQYIGFMQGIRLVLALFSEKR